MVRRLYYRHYLDSCCTSCWLPLSLSLSLSLSFFLSPSAVPCWVKPRYLSSKRFDQFFFCSLPPSCSSRQGCWFFRWSHSNNDDDVVVVDFHSFNSRPWSKKQSVWAARSTTNKRTTDLLFFFFFKSCFGQGQKKRSSGEAIVMTDKRRLCTKVSSSSSSNLCTSFNWLLPPVRKKFKWVAMKVRQFWHILAKKWKK